MGAGPPQILAESTGAIGNTGATVTAQIGTDGLDTKYYFQYGETTAYGATIPEPAGDAGSGAEPATVEAKLTGLKPSTHYHFRAVAVNEAGEPVVGSDQGFTTLPPLAISDETAMSVASASATLHAEINPLGSDTHYYFEYGSSSCTDNPGTCQIVPSATGVDIGSGKVNQSADVNLEGLTPNTTYYFRVVATNVLGTVAEATESFTTYPPETPFSLPDHRAYELVSPTDKNGGDVGAGLLPADGQAAADGGAITYISLATFGKPQSGSIITQYISTRGASEWSTKAITPPMRPSASAILVQPYHFFTSDLTSAVLDWSNTQLTSEAIPEFDNLYGLQTNSGTYQLITKVPQLSTSPENYTVTFAGATPNLSHILFETNDPLAPEVSGNTSSLYEWNEAAIRLVSVLPAPANTPAGSGGAGDGSRTNLVNVISSDGKRIFWTDNNEQLYVRDSGEDSSTTIKLNASQRTPPLGDGSARFKAATPSGSRVFFTDGTPLTQAAGDNGGLYEYSFETHRLTNLTPDPVGNPGVEGLVGVSEDGSILYFVATAKLAAGATASSPNLYVARSGEITFVATLATEDNADWTESLDERTAEVTPDGGSLVFLSDASLTGYDNTDAIAGSRDSEVFLYSEATGKLTCVSCNPSGARPIGKATVPTGLNGSYQPGYLAADGSRVFFDTADALVPGDTNDKQDVYEWDHGTVYLISSGTSDDVSAFVDSSANGDDAFFTTRSQLVPQDQDENSDMYDARVNGGFPNEPPLAAPCSDEACQGPLSATPTPPTAATATFVAPAEDMAHGESPYGKPTRTHKKPHKHKQRHKKRHRQRTMRAKQRKARHHA